MRIVFNIEVGISVPSYVQAGEMLDKITQNLQETIGPKGAYDIQSFRARHKDVHDFSDQMMAQSSDAPDRRSFDRE